MALTEARGYRRPSKLRDTNADDRRVNIRVDQDRALERAFLRSACACELHRRDLVREYPHGALTVVVSTTDGPGARFFPYDDRSYISSVGGLCADQAR